VRIVTFGVANSLDNFIARVDHSTDWLKWDDEVAEISASYWKTIDTVVMGRKTYEVALRSGMTAYPGAKNIIFSRTLQPPPNADVDIIDADAATFVRDLKTQPGKGICVLGGGKLAQSLFNANLIDQVGVNIQPIILGAGIPLFLPMQKQTNLELIEHRVLKSGSVYLLYRVLR
jgi:dihydrofolate reductase